MEDHIYETHTCKVNGIKIENYAIVVLEIADIFTFKTY